MAPKRKAESCLVGPSKKRALESRSEDLGSAFADVGERMLAGLTELNARTEKQLQENETLLEADGHFAQLAADLRQRATEAKVEKLRSVIEETFRQHKEEHLAYHGQYMARLERMNDELSIHAKLDMMQLVRTEFRKPTETDDHGRPAWEETMDRKNPLYTAEMGRGRFCAQVEEMWEDWCQRMDAVAPEDRGTVLPRSVKNIRAAKDAKLAEWRELTRAAEARRVAERAAEAERLWELAQVQQRLPPIPRHAPGQHPGYRSRRGQVKWSKRAEAPPPPTRRVPMKLAAPEKPASKRKGKGRGKK
ncbi:hypothetical protein MMC07_001277 [Pseudocyphellaria aurata]|nr:hypothetical protein [Pseudocyphellaria aurata]